MNFKVYSLTQGYWSLRDDGRRVATLAYCTVLNLQARLSMFSVFRVLMHGFE